MLDTWASQKSSKTDDVFKCLILKNKKNKQNLLF